MEDKNLDPVELKKRILLPHLDFVEQTLKRVKGTSFEVKWKIMHEIITSDKKRPPYEKIKQLEKTLLMLKNEADKSKQKNSTANNEFQSDNRDTPSTSNSSANQTANPPLNNERDPRKKVAQDQAIQKTIYRQTSSESEQGKSSEQRQPFPGGSSRDVRNSDFNNARFGSNKRHSSVFPDRRRYLGKNQFERVREDLQLKRKRSESPFGVNRPQQMPKRRYSCYDDEPFIERRSPTENAPRRNESPFARGSFRPIDRQAGMPKRRISCYDQTSPERFENLRGSRQNESPPRGAAIKLSERSKSMPRRRPSSYETSSKSQRKSPVRFPSDMNVKKNVIDLTAIRSGDKEPIIKVMRNVSSTVSKSAVPKKKSVSSLVNTINKMNSYKIPKLSDKKKPSTSEESKTSPILAKAIKKIASLNIPKVSGSKLLEKRLKENPLRRETIDRLGTKSDITSPSKEPTTSTTNNPPIEQDKATILTSILKDQDDNPEKILEGLMSVLGTEKLKKMQELLLKKAIETTEEKKSEGETSGNNLREPNSSEEKEIKIAENKQLSVESDAIAIAPSKEISTQEKVEEVKQSTVKLDAIAKKPKNAKNKQLSVESDAIMAKSSKEIRSDEKAKEVKQSTVKLDAVATKSSTETIKQPAVRSDSNNDNTKITETKVEAPKVLNKNEANASNLQEKEKETETNKGVTSETSNAVPPNVIVKKPKKKKMNELDKLHQDILGAYDCEGILKACTQPRVCTKTKMFEEQPPSAKTTPSPRTSTSKVHETVPVTINLIRLDLSPADMPITINEEFYKTFIGVNDSKSKVGPLSMKVAELIKPVKAVVPPPIIKDELVAKIIQEDMDIEDEAVPKIDVQPEEEPKDEKTTPNDSLDKKTKKKRKGLLWSKGILKKKLKRFKLHKVTDWEDVDSSDENANYENVVKMVKFKDILEKFAQKCGFEETKRKRIIRRLRPLTLGRKPRKTVEETKGKEENSPEMIQNKQPDQKPTEVTNVPKVFKPQTFVKLMHVQNKINLPLDNARLAVVSKPFSSTESKPGSIPKITIKLPPTDNIKTSTCLLTQRVESASEPVKRPVELSPSMSSLPSPTQKVVVVKPLSREIGQNVTIRSLNPKEQEALIAALSNKKPLMVVPQNNFVEKMINTNTAVSVTKVVQRSPHDVPSTSTDSSAQKNAPMISNAVTFNQTAITAPKSSTAVQSQAPKVNPLVEIIRGTKKQELSNPFKAVAGSTVNSQTAQSATPEPVPVTPSVEVVDLLDDEDDDVMDVLRPWIDKTEFKNKKDEKLCRSMTSNTHCLASLFKCMGSTCDFYTNNRDLFYMHLELHREHQLSDSSNYLLCSYCKFRSNSIHVLVIHLETQHTYAKYGCRYCFYRSVNEYQVTANHHMNFHRTLDKCMITFMPKRNKNENTEKNFISETIPKVVPALPCLYCQVKIYTFKEYEAHIQNHKENHKTLCSKCEQPMTKQTVIQHLQNCFTKFGNFQCVFCVFGTCNFSTIDNHLSTMHPDKLSYFAERSLNYGKDCTSIEALTIKELSKKVTGKVKKYILKYSFDDEIYRNEANVGKISENLEFFKKVASRPSDRPQPQILQIGEVMSLHD